LLATDHHKIDDAFFAALKQHFTDIPVASAERICTALCALETSRSPHPVLLTRRAADLWAPASARFGGGAAHVQHPRPSSCLEEPQRASTQCAGLRDARPTC
jgi:hypothetical protein